MRPGIEPESLWILVGFVNTESQWQLPVSGILSEVEHLIFIGHLYFSQRLWTTFLSLTLSWNRFRIIQDYGVPIVAQQK